LFLHQSFAEIHRPAKARLRQKSSRLRKRRLGPHRAVGIGGRSVDRRTPSPAAVQPELRPVMCCAGIATAVSLRTNQGSNSAGRPVDRSCFCGKPRRPVPAVRGQLFFDLPPNLMLIKRKENPHA
jgi:hypothetical protein